MKLLIALIMLVSSTAMAQVERYYNSTWNFSVVFPYKYKESVAPNVDFMVCALGENGDEYVVSTLVLPPNELTGDVLEKKFAASIVGTQGKISKIDVSYKGYPGKQFEIRSAHFIFYGRIYLVRDTLYTQLIATKPDAILPISPNSFYESLKITR